MTPSVDELLKALGKSHVDPIVVDLMHRLDLAHKKIRLKRGDFDVAYAAPAHGIDIGFEVADKFLKIRGIPDAALVCDRVIFFAEERERHRQYPFALPAGLVFGHSRGDARQLLGPPEFTSPILPVDRWSWNGIKLAVAYSDDESSIVSVNCDLAPSE